MSNSINIITRQYVATTIEGELATSGVYDSEFDAVGDLKNGQVDTSCAIQIIEVFVSYGRVVAVDVWQHSSIDDYFKDNFGTGEK